MSVFPCVLALPSCTFQMRFVNELLGRCGLSLKICIPMAPQYLTAPTLQPGALQCYRTYAASRSFSMETLHLPPRQFVGSKVANCDQAAEAPGGCQVGRVCTVPAGSHNAQAIWDPPRAPFLFLASPSQLGNKAGSARAAALALRPTPTHWRLETRKSQH